MVPTVPDVPLSLGASARILEPVRQLSLLVQQPRLSTHTWCLSSSLSQLLHVEHEYQRSEDALYVVQEDLTMMVAVERGNQGAVQVVHLHERQSSVGLHMGICGEPGMARGPGWNHGMPLLLLPARYQMIDSDTAPALMTELLMVRPRSSHESPASRLKLTDRANGAGTGKSPSKEHQNIRFAAGLSSDA